jgi:hypothetical protein
MSVSLSVAAASVDVVKLNNSADTLKITVFVRHLGLPPYNNRALPRGQLSCALVPSVLRRVVVATPDSIAPFTAHAITLSIAQHAGSSVDDLLSQMRDWDASGLELAIAWSPDEIKTNELACKCNIVASVPFYSFTGALRDFAPPAGIPRYNICLIGAPGVGKSSLANSLQTLNSDSDDVATIAAVGGLARHVTQELTRYCLPAPLRVALWDIWGSTPDSFDRAQFKALLSGTLPSGWHMGADIEAHRPLLDAHASTRVERRAHVVLFVLTVEVLQNEQLMAMYRDALACVRAAQLEALFVFTKVDTAGVDMSEWAMRVGGNTGAYFREQRAALCSALGANVRAYAICNYVAHEHKNFVIDAHLYQLLHDALSCASHFCRRNPPAPPQPADEPIPFSIVNDDQFLDDAEDKDVGDALDINAADFICPITQQVMIDPVIAADGFNYERSAIEMWIARVSPNVRSPMTNEPMPPTLVDNHELKAQIANYNESQE